MPGEEEYDIDIIFTPATLERKTKSNVLCCNNNQSLWYRHSKTKIKNTFKEFLKEWYLPPYSREPHRSAEITFTALRNNGYKLDSDALSSSTYKWAIDVLTEQNYLIDDDACRVVLEPTELRVPGSIETQVRMQVKFKEPR